MSLAQALQALRDGVDDILTIEVITRADVGSGSEIVAATRLSPDYDGVSFMSESLPPDLAEDVLSAHQAAVDCAVASRLAYAQLFQDALF